MHAIYSHTENTYIHKKESQHSEMGPVRQNSIQGTLKGKERKSIYIAPFCIKVHTKRSGMDHTVYLQTTPCLPFLRGVHQMSPPQQLRQQTSNCSSLLIYRPRKDETLSWPSWLTYSGWLTHISGHPSATRSVHVCVHCTVHNCCAQYCTEQT